MTKSELKGKCDVAWETQGELGIARLVAESMLDFFKYEPPPEVPQAIKTYSTMTFEQKADWDKKNLNWQQNPIIVDYRKEDSRVRSKAISDLWWLTAWMDLLNKNGEVVLAGKIRTKLNEYTPGVVSKDQWET